MNGIETESKEILQKLVVPKGDSCDGCLHCTTKLKQLVNMFGDPTEIVEEYYCDFFNQELSENGKEFCCKKSVSKCFQCKMNFMSDEERNSNFEQMLLLMLGFDFDETNHISPDEFGENFTLPDGEKGEICQMTFTLHNEQAERKG